MELSIKCITWNMGKSVKKILDWKTEIYEWAIISPDTDIIFITIQETSKEIGQNIFYEALKTKLPNYSIFHEGEGISNRLTGDFYVYGYLCVKSGINITKKPIPNDSKDNTINSMCIYKTGVCTKASIGFGIVIDETKLIFICSHLPVNTKDKLNASFGYNERIDAMKLIKTHIIDNVRESLDGVDYIFWGGDMNMRIQTDTNKTEQLEQILNSNIPEFVGFKEWDKTNIKKTCRYIEYNEKTDDYSQFIEKRNDISIESGYDPKRNPSYCDRFIYTGNLLNAKYYSWPQSLIYPKSIAYSDHSVVVFDTKIIKKLPLIVNFYWIRHGFSCANRLESKGLLINLARPLVTLDAALSDEGVNQAKQLNLQLLYPTSASKLIGLKFDAVICSNMRRAMETALYIFNGTEYKTLYVVPFISEDRDPRAKAINIDRENVPMGSKYLEPHYDTIKQNDKLTMNADFSILKKYEILTKKLDPNYDTFIKQIFPLIIGKIGQKQEYNIAVVSHNHFIKNHLNNNSLSTNNVVSIKNTEMWKEKVKVNLVSGKIIKYLNEPMMENCTGALCNIGLEKLYDGVNPPNEKTEIGRCKMYQNNVYKFISKGGGDNNDDEYYHKYIKYKNKYLNSK